MIPLLPLPLGYLNNLDRMESNSIVKPPVGRRFLLSTRLLR